MNVRNARLNCYLFLKKEIYHECFLSDGASYFKYIAAFVGTCSFEFLKTNKDVLEALSLQEIHDFIPNLFESKSLGRVQQLF